MNITRQMFFSFWVMIFYILFVNYVIIDFILEFNDPVLQLSMAIGSLYIGIELVLRLSVNQE